jgi:hypothetical protein
MKPYTKGRFDHSSQKPTSLTWWILTRKNSIERKKPGRWK